MCIPFRTPVEETGQNHQAVAKHKARIVPLNKFEFDSKIPFKCKHDVYITGIGVTRDDHLLLCNWRSTDVMVLSDDGKQLNDIGLEGTPWGIVVVPDKEEAIVTLPNKNCIQIINTSTMRAEQKIMVPVQCYGITLIDNDIVLGNRGVIYIINRGSTS